MLRSKPGVVGATITLHGGGYFDFLDPKPEMIRPRDIAYGLGNTCRFGGQSLWFYSVAQHSVLVADLVREAGGDDEEQFAALMHDGSEAYVGDMVGPLKQLCPDYKAVEDRVERALAARFGLTLPWSPLIKHADLRALRTEQRDLTSGHGDNWNGLDDYQPAAATITPLGPFDAAVLWHARFTDMGGYAR